MHFIGLYAKSNKETFFIFLRQQKVNKVSKTGQVWLFYHKCYLTRYIFFFENRGKTKDQHYMEADKVMCMTAVGIFRNHCCFCFNFYHFHYFQWNRNLSMCGSLLPAHSHNMKLLHFLTTSREGGRWQPENFNHANFVCPPISHFSLCLIFQLRCCSCKVWAITHQASTTLNQPSHK